MTSLENQRRDVLRMAACLATGITCGHGAVAQGVADGGFDARSLDDALRALGGIPQVVGAIDLTAPERVENGAVVPVSVFSRLPGTQEISIVVESNPNPLVVRFLIPEGTEPFISTRVKMAQSGSIYAVVRADGGLYGARCSAQVTVGGCGG